MGPRANYKCGALVYNWHILVCRLYVVNFIDMWDCPGKACPGKFLRITPTKIEVESNFSSISQHSRSSEYSKFLIAENFEN